jgi:HK97 family phage major capsid protein
VKQLPLIIFADAAELGLELEATAAETVDRERRIIEGTIAPYGEVGVAHVSPPGQDGLEPRRMRFRPGSLSPARERVPLVLEHDRGAPVGVLANLADAADALRGRFAIDATRAGDDALVQAASGSRSGLTAGAIADEWIEAADGTIEVIRGRLFHVGLTTLAAFPSAEVSRVAASSAETTTERSSAMTEQEIRALIEGATTDEALAELLEHENEDVRTAAAAERDRRQAAAAASAATNPDQGRLETESRSAERPVVLTRERNSSRELQCSAGELVLHMVRAERGDRDSARVVEAVLSVIDSTDVPGLMPPAYVETITGLIERPRPLADRVAVRRPLPATGMTITKPNWTTLPDGGWVAENADIPSNAPAMGSDDVAVLEWAWGVAMSYAVATRSSPDAIESLYRAAIQDYYNDVEQKIADALMLVDQAGAAGAGVGSAIAAFYGDELDAPNLLVVAPDIYGDLVDAVDTVPTYSSGEVSGATMRGVIAGLEVVVSPHLPAGTELITVRGVVELREQTPVRLTANVIGALKVELGVTGFATFDTERPNAVHALTPAAGAPAGQSEAKRTARKSSKKKD